MAARLEQEPSMRTGRQTPLTTEEERAIRQAPKMIEDRLVVTLLLSMGLQLGELLAINRRDVDLEGWTLLVRRLRGRPVSRDLYIPAECRKYLSWKFSMSERMGLSARTVQRIVRRAALDAGIEGRVTPWTLRQTYIAREMTKGTHPATLQRKLGEERERRP